LADFLSYITSIFFILTFFLVIAITLKQQQKSITTTGKTPLLMFQILQVVVRMLADFLTTSPLTATTL
jgi:hypothetical protein